MALGDILDKLGKQRIYSIFIGILYVFISYGTAKLFFPTNISIAMIFFISLLLIPSTGKMISMEEKLERKHGLKHFLRDHKLLMEVFLFLFIGIFLAYLVIGNNSPVTMEYQNTYLESQGIKDGIVPEKIDKPSQFVSILGSNLSVIVIAFVLSMFYGMGALFLIVLNASIFAAFVLKFSSILSQTTTMSAAILSIHFLPEVFGFLLAAMAGGVISKAITKEKFGTDKFKNVVKDGTVLLLISLAVILVAAGLEVFVTSSIISSLI